MNFFQNKKLFRTTDLLKPSHGGYMAGQSLQQYKVGCGLELLMPFHGTHPRNAFSWWNDHIENELSFFPELKVVSLPDQFYEGNWGAINSENIIAFNLETASYSDERWIQCSFCHELAHALGYLAFAGNETTPPTLYYHDKFFLHAHYLINSRLGFEFTDEEIDVEYCLSDEREFRKPEALMFAKDMSNRAIEEKKSLKNLRDYYYCLML